LDFPFAEEGNGARETVGRRERSVDGADAGADAGTGAGAGVGFLAVETDRERVGGLAVVAVGVVVDAVGVVDAGLAGTRFEGTTAFVFTAVVVVDFGCATLSTRSSSDASASVSAAVLVVVAARRARVVRTGALDGAGAAAAAAGFAAAFTTGMVC
jgi:hypothetical protein